MHRILICFVICLAPLTQAHSEWTQLANSLDELAQKVEGLSSYLTLIINNIKYVTEEKYLDAVQTPDGHDEVHQINAIMREHRDLLAIRNEEFRSKLEPLYRQRDYYDNLDDSGFDFDEMEEYLAQFRAVINDVEDLTRIIKAYDEQIEELNQQILSRKKAYFNRQDQRDQEILGIKQQKLEEFRQQGQVFAKRRDEIARIFSAILTQLGGIGHNHSADINKKLDKVFEHTRAAGVAFSAVENTHYLQLPPYFATCLDSIFVARGWVPDSSDDELPPQDLEIDSKFCRDTLSLLMADTVNGLQPLAQALAEEVLLDIAVSVVFPEMALLKHLAKAKKLLNLPQAAKTKIIGVMESIRNSAGKAKLGSDGLKGIKNIPAGKASDVMGKFRQGADLIESYIGEGGRFIRNKAGDVVILSKDGTRRVRFDINKPYPHKNPHTHVEELVGGKWKKSGPIYPTDVPPN